MSAVQPQAVPAMTVASGNRNAKNIPVGPEGREWSYGLFDCFATPGTCVLTFRRAVRDRLPYCPSFSQT